MIYSLNGNLFGPATAASEKIEEAVAAVSLIRMLPLYEAIAAGPGLLRTLGQQTIAAADVKRLNLRIMDVGTKVGCDPIDMGAELQSHFVDSEQVIISDHYDGRLNEFDEIGTNYPIQLQNCISSKLFSTDGRTIVSRHEDCVDGSVLTAGRQSFFYFEDAVMRGMTEPLQQNGQPIMATAELGKRTVTTSAFEPKVVIEDPVLYLAHPWSFNYNIFIHETILSVLFLDLLPKDIKIFVKADQFRIDCLGLLGVPSERLLVLRTNDILFRRVYVPTRRFNLKYLGADLFTIYNRMRSRLSEAASVTPKPGRKVFLDRKLVPTSTGNNRFVINADELRALLKRGGYETVCTEDMNFNEKFEALSDCDTIVSAIGANLVNVGLARNIRRVVLLSSPVWGHFKFFWSHLLQRNHPDAEINLFLDCRVEDNDLSPDLFNKPFYVDCSKLSTILGIDNS